MSSIQNAMRGMGYQPPYARDGCHNCAFARTEARQTPGRFSVTCTKGGFFASPTAICQHHQPPRPPGQPLGRQWPPPTPQQAKAEPPPVKKAGLLDSGFDGPDPEQEADRFNADAEIYISELRKMVHDLVNALSGEAKAGG
ncbi:hypothetical protein [Ottowia sp.]|uniref:hypothetical protein n=1 Tax=Ottowia sp. TaxID=1898956 RepID=UPI003A8AA59D